MSNTNRGDNALLIHATIRARKSLRGRRTKARDTKEWTTGIDSSRCKHGKRGGVPLTPLRSEGRQEGGQWRKVPSTTLIHEDSEDHSLKGEISMVTHLHPSSPPNELVLLMGRSALVFNQALAICVKADGYERQDAQSR